MGELETCLMRMVWTSACGLTPAEATDGLKGEVAYTTALTVLTRLWRKGQLTRLREGKAHRYTATTTEAEWIAGKMRAALESASDQDLALTRFVSSLNETDAAALRLLLQRNATT